MRDEALYGGETDRLISVIVPAYNCAATIGETLHSIRAQTHVNIEIIVVDDGSTDETYLVATQHAAADPRIRVFRQPNGGVASARNRAIRESAADLIAPIDADDIWLPEKLELQLSALDSFPNVGLVYTWFARIDVQGRVIEIDNRHTAEGNVLAELCVRNIVGHASSPLILRSAIERVGGYDETFRIRNAQGCEDNKLYLEIAEYYSFAVVKKCVVGYREMPTGMSSNLHQMLRSRDLSVEAVLDRHPELADNLRRGRAQMLKWLFLRSLRSKMYSSAGKLLAEMIRTSPRAAIAYSTNFLLKRLIGKASLREDALEGTKFYIPM
ncbi:glycosyltransferase family 2 protein [Croceibacterium ferulae]|uniref:glycosyltransferase family 2 protein n=1 Tax=Croceibacterium ferulae TaxID=1854641 RepID=UPI000EAC7ED9|nr:glycosyltransferase family 2 protein [Croceibacterium ferulae]